MCAHLKWEKFVKSKNHLVGAAIAKMQKEVEIFIWFVAKQENKLTPATPGALLVIQWVSQPSEGTHDIQHNHGHKHKYEHYQHINWQLVNDKTPRLHLNNDYCSWP